MTDHPAKAAVPVTGTPDRGLLQALLIGRYGYVFGTGEDPTSFVPAEGGAVTLVLGYQGKWFWLDPDDATTAHDGVTCIVAAGGERYKIFGVDLLVTSVISHTLDTPPDPEDEDEEARPQYGDAYRVPAAATGAWSGHEDEIAVWTTREEWEFIPPKPGWLVWTRNVGGYDVAYHYDSTQGEWLAGFPGQIHPDQTIPQSAAINFGKFFIVENQTTNAPPGSPSVPTAYVIGPSPTGAWTGHAGKLAICEADGSFKIVAPTAGWRIYDKALGRDFQFNGSAWQSATGRWRTKLTEFTASGIFTKEARCFQVKVSVVAGGGGSGFGTGDGGSVSFGVHLSATGGAIGSGPAGGAGGAGDAPGGLTFSGRPGRSVDDGGDGGEPGLIFGTRGWGALGTSGTGNAGGGGGGAAQLIIPTDQLETNVTVTINTGGVSNGYVLVEEYIED